MSALLTLPIGATFAGDFRVERPLSQGGMGAVYVVAQLSTGKQRALKVMLPGLLVDGSARARFEQEARVAAQIESEHVIEVVAAGVDGATKMPWLAMELLSGEDLAKLVERRGALSAHEVLAIFEQLGHALAAAHRARVIHRDLKPENIFLASSRHAGAPFTVKVLDFGIAKVLQEANTQLTAPVGSPMWMAPEQTDTQAVSAATDVWALGLIAFYLLTGRYFWKAPNRQDCTVAQLFVEILIEAIPAPTERARELGAPVPPPAFDAWFARCVAREIDRRFTDADAALVALREALSVSTPLKVGGASLSFAATLQHTAESAVKPGRPSGDGTSAVTAQGTRAGASAARRWRWHQAALLGLGVCTVGGAWLLFEHKRAAQDEASSPPHAQQLPAQPQTELAARAVETQPFLVESGAAAPVVTQVSALPVRAQAQPKATRAPRALDSERVTRPLAATPHGPAEPDTTQAPPTNSVPPAVAALPAAEPEQPAPARAAKADVERLSALFPQIKRSRDQLWKAAGELTRAQVAACAAAQVDSCTSNKVLLQLSEYMKGDNLSAAPARVVDQAIAGLTGQIAACAQGEELLRRCAAAK